jgi:hypothetical protein
MDDAVGSIASKLAEDTSLPAGTPITVIWGEETFSPVQYNSFRIGGHSVTVIVQEGEAAIDAWKRGWALLEQAAEVQFVDKLSGFADRMNRAKTETSRR